MPNSIKFNQFFFMAMCNCDSTASSVNVFYGLQHHIRVNKHHHGPQWLAADLCSLVRWRKEQKQRHLLGNDRQPLYGECFHTPPTEVTLPHFQPTRERSFLLPSLAVEKKCFNSSKWERLWSRICRSILFIYYLSECHIYFLSTVASSNSLDLCHCSIVTINVVTVQCATVAIRRVPALRWVAIFHFIFHYIHSPSVFFTQRSATQVKWKEMTLG